MNIHEVLTPSNTLDQLGAIRSALALQLLGMLDLSLEQSFDRVLRQPVRKVINPYLDNFCQHLSDYLEKTGSHNKELCDSIIICPVIQQADHSGILLDNEIFFNNLFFSLALSSKKTPYGLTIQCSTVKCISSRSPLKGPLFLNNGTNPIRLSNATNSNLKSKSFCNLPSPFQISISGIFDQQSESLRRFRDEWNMKTFPCAEDAFMAINTRLGETIAADTGTSITFLDERFTSFLAARQLYDTQLPIGHLIFDPDIRNTVLKIRKKTVNSSENYVLGHDLTDFFYFKSKEKLEPLLIENCANSDEIILKRRSDDSVLAKVGKTGLARLLEDQTLYCDRFLGYIVRCFSSGVKALGGTSQQDSIRLYRQIMEESNAEISFMSQAVQDLYFREELTFLSGAPYFDGIEKTQLESIVLGGGADLGKFTKFIKKKNIKDLIGNFQSSRFLLENFFKRKGEVIQ